MATLEIVNKFEIDSQGVTASGKHGAATLSQDDPFEITVTGTIHSLVGRLTTATVVTVYDDDNDVPIDWDYLFYWADQDSYIQIIGSGTNAIFKVLALTPFTLSYDSILCAADTTIIAGGTEPTLTDIDSIVIGNYSGSTLNYRFCVID